MNQPLPAPVLHARQAYRWTAAVADVLTTLRRRFEGDLDLYLLLMVFVQAEMERGLSGPRPSPIGLNALSVASACGIPRETARGKLRRLVTAGWLRSDANGLHYLSARVDRFGEYGALNRIAATGTRP